MTHTQGILAQLKAAEDDDDLPEDIRENCRERREEIEDEEADDAT